MFAAVAVEPSLVWAADVVAVIAPEQREAERATVETVGDRLGDALLVRTATTPTSKQALAAATASSRGARFALGLDARAGEIVVRRAKDATLLSRSIPPKTWSESPYSAALVALELLELAREVPLKAPPPPPPPPPPPSVVVVTPTVTPVDEERSWGPYVAAQVGGVVDWSAGNEVTLLRPFAAIGVGLALETLRLGLDLRVAPFGRTSADAFEFETSYVRHDADVDVLALYVAGAYRWGGGLRLGVSYVGVEIESSEPVRDTRLLPWVGLEARAERDFGGGFGVALILGADWVPTPPRFLVFDAPVLYERGFRAHLGLAVRWSSR